MALIGLSHGAEAVKEAISEADADADGYVEFDEFVVMMQRAQEIRGSGSVIWDGLWETRKTVLCWLSFPAAMTLLVAVCAIFSFRYIATIDDAIRVGNAIFDIAYKMPWAVGTSECPPSLLNCSLVTGPHWPYAYEITALYKKKGFWLLVHVASVSTAFMIFPLQFWKGLRSWSVENSNGVHKWMGRTAISLLVFIAMPTSSVLADGPAKSQLISRLGFYSMLLSVIATASKGWMCARQKKFAEHQKWMTRCFGIMLSGFFIFRLLLAVLTWIPFDIFWPLLTCSTTPLGLFLAELYMRRTAEDQEKYLGIVAAGRAGGLSKSLQLHKDGP